MKILGINLLSEKAKQAEIVKSLDKYMETKAAQIIVNEQTLYQMLFETMAPFLKLKKDSNLLSVVTDGYESSPNVFSITNKVITMFSQIPYKILKGDTELKQGETGPLEALFENNPSDYTVGEFMKDWEAQGLIFGEAITYHLSRSGIRDLIHLQIAPAQHVEILYGTFDNPVKGYNLDLTADTHKTIPPDNIWHVRLFPNLDFREGKNYRGLSPIKVAARVINSEIFGDEIVENTYKRGMPPGILSKKTDQFNLTNVEAQRKDMESVWDKKYSRTRAGKPIFTVGDLQWLPIGFSNFTDLQIAEINKRALRTLCNMWGIPSRVMNDMEGGAYTKDKEDRKAIYTNRLIPDIRLFWNGINRLIKSSGYRYEINLDEIPELQEDKLERAKVDQIYYQCNALQINELRVNAGMEPDPSQEGLYRSEVEVNPMTQQTQLPEDKL